MTGSPDSLSSPAASLSPSPAQNPPAPQSEGSGRPTLRRMFQSRLLWNCLLPLADAATFLGLGSALYALRLNYNHPPYFGGPSFAPSLTYITVVLLTVAVMGGYRPHGAYRTLSFSAEFILAVIAGSLMGAFFIYGIFTARDLMVIESRAVLALSSVAFVPVGLLVRVVLDSIRERFTGTLPYLVIGPSRKVAEFQESYSHTGLHNPLEFALLDDPPEILPATGRVASLSGMDWAALRQQYEAVILCENPSEMREELLQTLVRTHFGVIPVFTLNSFYATMWRQVPTLNLNLGWTLEQDFNLAQRSYYRYLKRGFDLVFATAMLILLLPLLLLIACAVKLESRGPVFYTQTRVGRGGKRFTLYKFRTMQVGSDRADGNPYTQENDRRVTRVGAILRPLRADEIPQILNIWKGDMSLIGPRAEWDRLVEVYEKEIPYYHLRHLVKPGLTGWAQLNYSYGASLEDAVEKLKYDLYYIKFYSPLLDIEIVLKTILRVISFGGR